MANTDATIATHLNRDRIPTADVRARIHEGLSFLIMSPPEPRRSALDEQLAPHRDLIAQAVSKGHTYRTIATTLTEAGLKVSPESVRRYVQRTNGRVKPKVRRGSKP